jgi:hypothetical protein
MIFLIVGSDATGKTNLANKLKKATGMPIIKKSAPVTQQEFDDMFEEYRSLFISSNNFIMDRSFYCEMVYGPIFRGFSAISQEQCAELEAILATKGCVIYHCTDEPERIFERFKQTKEAFVTTLEQVTRIVNGYKELLGPATIIPVVEYKEHEQTNKE